VQAIAQLRQRCKDINPKPAGMLFATQAAGPPWHCLLLLVLFHGSLLDLVGFDDDACYRRFLRARKLDVEKAFIMYDNCVVRSIFLLPRLGSRSYCFARRSGV
jgi:hypothetical protein